MNSVFEGREVFGIPAAFISERLALRTSEIAYGFFHGWLAAEDVVDIAVLRLDQDDSGDLEQLAMLLPDEFDRVGPLLSEWEASTAILQSIEEKERVWLVLAVDWILEHQENYLDPIAHIESIWADFGHPPELNGAVRALSNAAYRTDDDQLLEAAPRFAERHLRELASRDSN